MRSAFFWDVTRRRLVVLYQRFGSTCLSHLQGSSSWRRRQGTQLRSFYRDLPVYQSTNLRCVVSQKTAGVKNLVPFYPCPMWSCRGERGHFPPRQCSCSRACAPYTTHWQCSEVKFVMQCYSISLKHSVLLTVSTVTKLGKVLWCRRHHSNCLAGGVFSRSQCRLLALWCPLACPLVNPSASNSAAPTGRIYMKFDTGHFYEIGLRNYKFV
jgi:hypothetical protein